MAANDDAPGGEDKAPKNAFTRFKTVGTYAGAVVSIAAVVGLGIQGWNWWQDRNTPETEFDRTPNLGLEFWQGDEQDAMFFRDEAEDAIRVKMDRGSFLFRVPKVDEDMAVQLCAWTDDSIFRLRADIPADEIPYLRQGRGVADSDYASGRLSISKDSRNYLIGTRLRRNGDQDQVFFTTLSRLGHPDERLSDQREDLYLTFYIDRNADRMIDLGEFEQVVLDF